MPTDDSTGRVKEVCRLIRLARSRWDAHDNGGAKRERSRAMKLYETLSSEEKDQIPQVLRVWLRYRSARYVGPQRARGAQARVKKSRVPAPTHRPDPQPHSGAEGTTD